MQNALKHLGLAAASGASISLAYHLGQGNQAPTATPAPVVNVTLPQKEKVRHGNGKERGFTPNYDGGIKNYAKWDENWDFRSPKEEHNEDKRFKVIEAPKDKNAYRTVILVRHGQYFDDVPEAENPKAKLTEKGHLQAQYTGKRLAQMIHTWKADAEKAHAKKVEKMKKEGKPEEEIPKFSFPTVNLIQSPFTRAQQTADEIKKVLDQEKVDWKFQEECGLIAEAFPYLPEIARRSRRWEKPELFKESVQVEAGFRKFMHRPDQDQEGRSIDVIVCHGNVIRYWTTRALQIPPERWLNGSVPHASITTLNIRSSGWVSMNCWGDSGFIPMEKVTFYGTE